MGCRCQWRPGRGPAAYACPHSVSPGFLVSGAVSGHSKWASIKHKKAATDARRGQLFTKLARAITVAAREGGGDPDANFTLAAAIQKARDYSMPKDNIQRAIDRGAGGGRRRTTRSSGSSTRATGPAARRSWSRR